jgi:SAM-dependent methyltransferase
MPMNRQDFEEYARIKTFNLSITDTWSGALREVLDQIGRPRAEVRFLDHGCGDGKIFTHVIGQDLTPDNVHGVELSRIRVERCQAMGWRHALQIEKGQRLPYPDAYFDVVNLMEVIEHIPKAEVGQVLSEIRRVLKPTGVLIGTTPNYPIKRFYDIYDALVHRMWIRLRDDPTHVSFYNHAQLRRVLRAHFGRVDTHCFKPGFLYRRVMRAPFLMHKILFVCGDRIAAVS